MSETELILEWEGVPLVFPPFSARECTQTLTLTPPGVLRRTLTGELIFLGSPAFQKFSSTITCKDQTVPPFEGLHQGTLLKIGCIQTLTQSIPPRSSAIQLAREPVSLSLSDSKGNLFEMPMFQNKDVTLPQHFPGGFITYRPWLWMLVKSYVLETHEWGPAVSWTLELEER